MEFNSKEIFDELNKKQFNILTIFEYIEYKGYQVNKETLLSVYKELIKEKEIRDKCGYILNQIKNVMGINPDECKVYADANTIYYLELDDTFTIGDEEVVITSDMKKSIVLNYISNKKYPLKSQVVASVACRLANYIYLLEFIKKNCIHECEGFLILDEIKEKVANDILVSGFNYIIDEINSKLESYTKTYYATSSEDFNKYVPLKRC